MSDEEVVSAEIVPATPRKMSPRSKFTAQLAKKVLSSMDNGLPFNHACALAGIHPQTGAKWLRMAEEDENSPYAEFALEVLQRKARYMSELIEEWRETASMTKQWTGLATLAERLDPDNFSQKKGPQVAVQVNVGNFEKKLHEIHASSEIKYDGG